MPSLAGQSMSYILGLPIFALTVAIALPIPLGNILPVVAVCVIALGLIERDCLMVLLGILLMLFALLTAALLHGTISFMSTL
jgi:hypothetical protein